MKTCFLCFLFSALTVWQVCAGGIQIGLTDSQKEIPTNEWGAVTYNTQISIALNSTEKEFKANQVVQLLVRIKNLSTNEEYGVYVQGDFKLTGGLSFAVTSPSGKDVSPVFHDTNRGSGGFIWVHPNQIDGFGFQLDEICKTDEIGTYKIVLTMKRWTPDRKKSFEIVSNPLFITVVADK